MTRSPPHRHSCLDCRPGANSSEYGNVSHVLTTQRLVLRPVTTGDHAALLMHWTAPDVREFLFDGEILSSATISQVIADGERNFAAAGYGLWLVFESETSQPTGTAGLRPLEDLGIE